MAALIPAENWPPYRWLWQRIGGRPWTHIMRDHWRLVLPLLLALFVVLLAWQVRSRWRAVLAFGLGALAAHLWWVLLVTVCAWR